jgi:alanine dehydrogenase
VARTATHAFNNAAWPYIQAITRLGIEAALESIPALARGLNTRGGALVNPALLTSEVQ